VSIKAVSVKAVSVKAVSVKSAGNRGSMSVEFVIAAPMLVVLLLLIAFAGQWFNTTSQVGAAARDAARTASNIVNWDNVQPAAQAAANEDLNGVCTGDPTVLIDQPSPDAWAVGPGQEQDIEVTVSCTMNLDPFNYIGIHGNHTFSATAFAPLDPYSFRTGG
jgi:Flp pilus assembly protein TadG